MAETSLCRNTNEIPVPILFVKKGRFGLMICRYLAFYLVTFQGLYLLPVTYLTRIIDACSQYKSVMFGSALVHVGWGRTYRSAWMIEALFTWLLAPLSGATTHSIEGWAAWHARLMVFSWGGLMPIGAIAARFYKVTEAQDWPAQLDNKTWWHWHRWVQAVGVVVMTVGVVLALGAGARGGLSAWTHVGLGWFVCAVGWLQVAAGVSRGSKGGATDAQVRGDHYDMSRWRLWFERLHKGLGWLAIVVAVPTIAIGLKVADAPRWMAVVLMLWWIGVGSWFVRLQVLGRCMDTYQAIWGPDDVHPGNRMPPVGWGVRRYTAQSWRNRSGARTTQTH